MRECVKRNLMFLLMVLVMVCVIPRQQVEAKDIVIVLDPGHGGTESGAGRTWNGKEYREELLNLKIAKYVKAELETYSGVKVYMTRTNNNKTMDRETRILYAKSKKADALVSIHINSTGADRQTSMSGCFAAVPSTANYPNSNKYAKKSRALATSILKELSGSTGMKNNGFWIDDELGIILFGMRYKVPSMIIEHCFVNNPNDCSKYLKNASSLKKMGIADATGIAKYFKLQKDGVSWQKVGSKYYYYDENGVKQTGVTKINGSLYLLDEDGARCKGFVKMNGQCYYADSKGKLKLGWQTYNKKKYYFDKKTGAAKKGLQKIGSKKYYFNKTSGAMKIKWVTINGKRYYFSKVNGALLTNYWLKYNNKWYYLNKNGTPYTNRKKVINGKRYIFDAKGVCTNKE